MQLSSIQVSNAAALAKIYSHIFHCALPMLKAFCFVFLQESKNYSVALSVSYTHSHTHARTLLFYTRNTDALSCTSHSKHKQKNTHTCTQRSSLIHTNSYTPHFCLGKKVITFSPCLNAFKSLSGGDSPVSR